MMYKFYVSTNNAKTNNIPSFSLLPVLSCDINAPCVRECYAHKMIRRYYGLAVTWSENYNSILRDTSDLANFREYINSWIVCHDCSIFRWHVGGDILNMRYLQCLCEIALDNKRVIFYTYTKRFAILEKYLKNGGIIPKNLVIILSGWNEYQPSEYLANRFKMCQYDKDGSVADMYNIAKIKYHVCEGNCIKCRKCFNNYDGIIVFENH